MTSGPLLPNLARLARSRVPGADLPPTVSVRPQLVVSGLAPMAHASREWRPLARANGSHDTALANRGWCCSSADCLRAVRPGEHLARGAPRGEPAYRDGQAREREPRLPRDDRHEADFPGPVHRHEDRGVREAVGYTPNDALKEGLS